MNKLAIAREKRTTANDWQESGEEEEGEFSDGYLNGEEGEEESPIRKSTNQLPNKATKQNAMSLQGSLPKVKEGRTSLQQ